MGFYENNRVENVNNLRATPFDMIRRLNLCGYNSKFHDPTNIQKAGKETVMNNTQNLKFS